jgi:hypothetical protein
MSQVAQVPQQWFPIPRHPPTLGFEVAAWRNGEVAAGRKRLLSRNQSGTGSANSRLTLAHQPLVSTAPSVPPSPMTVTPVAAALDPHFEITPQKPAMAATRHDIYQVAEEVAGEAFGTNRREYRP